jgi:hypothetical protein
MSRVVLLPPGAWQAAGAQAEARVIAPGAGRLVVWADGADADALLHPASGAPVGFAVLGGCGFASIAATIGEPFRITASAPPRRCLVLLRPADGPSSSLGAGWPRAVSRPVRRPAPELGATRVRMDAALADHDLDGALAALADMLVLARDDVATQDAAAALLQHLARHPMRRSPALGALAAALTGMPA